MDFRFSPEDEALRQEAIDFTKKEWDPKGYGDGEGIYFGLSWYCMPPSPKKLTTTLLSFFICVALIKSLKFRKSQPPAPTFPFVFP